MAGGLIQIISYGSQDLYLTGTPEITFFKIVYRRHTNFSIESIEVPFDTPVSFGQESFVNLPKIGDLMSKVYLKIIVPALHFKRVNTNSENIQDDIDNALTLYNDAITNLQYVKDYIALMSEAFRFAYYDYITNNIINSEDLKDTLVGHLSDNNDKYNTVRDSLMLIDDFSNHFNENEANIYTIANTVDNDEPKDVLYKKLLSAIDYCRSIHDYYYYDMISKKEYYDDITNLYLKIAWVKKLGHAIIDYIQVTIGGNAIDKQYGDWLNVWHELTGNIHTESIYDRLIGNVREMTSFDKNGKPSYTMYIPLQFWFCREYGLALPLVSLQYHDVGFNIKFKNFVECAYVENDNYNRLIYAKNSDDGVYLDELDEDNGIILEASLLVDYVYLESSERRRFAQSSHEYLIEQLQVREFKGININKFKALLDFDHPCSELIWLAQKTEYTQNIDGFTECKWDKYTSTVKTNTKKNKYTGVTTIEQIHSGNIITYSQIDFNGHNRVEKRDGNYFNYVQPYAHHTKTPSDGINVYSFAFNPEKHQPSGQCNMSRLSQAVMYLDFDKSVFDNAIDPSNVINLRIYTQNKNILRFISGMAGCAYA